MSGCNARSAMADATRCTSGEGLRPGDGVRRWCARCAASEIHTYRVDRLFFANRHCWVCAACGMRTRFAAVRVNEPQ